MGRLSSSGIAGTPNYTARESRSHNTSYRATRDGWVYVYVRGGDTGAGLTYPSPSTELAIR